MEKSRRHSAWAAERADSYGVSFMYQLREARQESSSSFDFVWQAVQTIATTAVVSGLLIVMCGVAALMCYFGIVNIKDCPAQKQIPIYLLVGGGIGMVKLGTLFIKHRKIRREDLEDYAEEQNPGEEAAAGNNAHSIAAEDESEAYTSTPTRIAESMVSVFLLIWFGFGNYWVFSVYRPPPFQGDRSSEPNNWCNGAMYNFAFLQICICYGLIGLTVLTFLLLFTCALCLRRRPEWE